MAVANISNSGLTGQKAKALTATVGGATNAKFNEASSSGATFSTVINPDGDGKNYRLAKFTASGTLVVSQAGKAQVCFVAGGAQGGVGNYTHSYGGGGGGGVLITSADLPVGSLSVVVGAGGGGATGDTSGNRGNNTYIAQLPLTAVGGGSGQGEMQGWALIGGSGGGGKNGGGFVGINGQGNSGGGGGGGGAGSASSNGAGGAARSVTFDGTTQSYGKGGTMGNGTTAGGYSPVAGGANTGNGGGGLGNGSGGSTATYGGSGIAMIRVEI